MLLSRQARYTGLIDGLEFAEGELADAMAGATTWVAVNADESKLASQLETAKGAGVTRVFVLLTADGPTEALSDADALKATLEASGMTWTVMRTGSMSAAGGGGGLKLDEVDMATCAEVPKEDIFRFVTEALTIEESYSRMFSLCPSADVSQLKEMRMAGCDRREEAEALLRGQIQEGALEEQAKAAEEKAAAEGAASAKSAEEEEAEREEELKELLAKAKKKGEENAIKRAEEEKLKQARLGHAPHLIPLAAHPSHPAFPAAAGRARGAPRQHHARARRRRRQGRRQAGGARGVVAAVAARDAAGGRRGQAVGRRRRQAGRAAARDGVSGRRAGSNVPTRVKPYPIRAVIEPFSPRKTDLSHYILRSPDWRNCSIWLCGCGSSCVPSCVWLTVCTSGWRTSASIAERSLAARSDSRRRSASGDS